MAWDTAETRRRIKRAATAEFAQYGPDGTAIERIAKRAGVNKERVYNYFGDKRALFAAVLRDELAEVARSVPVESFAAEDIGDYAGRVYDYHRERPELIRLLRWEALSYDGEVPDETLRAEYYECKSEAVTKGQSAGTITADIDAPHLMLLVLSVAGWWSAVPQVARMLCGPLSEQEHVKRRAAVVTAVRRLAAPGSTPQLG
ncbi:TetR family transcriptional regulator [Actinomyces sp. oral taxon 448]|jgi:transcriptional regulator, TetR family|uniref:TetR family transcriptional regulator n=1 Tax=Actinomyces sp. oral taxon 448 TaxID=712124 RepID=UPI0002188C42|nr:TetR family transcriptional regulator [Actinomyces sp. oral taxon 448]EGQ75995.1 TetR family regulatory protein [Actinomyces sp. oral taxon 448 str. F0400]